MPKCIECEHCTLHGVEPKMRKRGVNLCVVLKQPTGTYLTLDNDRQCLQYSPASPDDAAARREWLAKQD